MSRPRQAIPEVDVDPGWKAPQPSLVNQVVAEPGEAKGGVVFAEVPSRDREEGFVRKARTVAVATYKTEIDHSADDQDVEIDVGERRRHCDLGQDVDGSQGFRV